ncbi:MAG: hypothetical protein R3F30_08750 [Planctomycetota bacterium]
MSRKLLVVPGVACLALAATLWEAPRPLPARLRLPSLLGPLRVLPVPFAWAEVGEAMRDQSAERLLRAARRLQALLPEHRALWVLLAWQQAYALSLAAPDPGRAADRIVEALGLVEEGLGVSPARQELLLLAGFMLQDRARDHRLATALAERLGEDPIRTAARYYDEAARLGHLARGDEDLILVLGVRLVGLGERRFAARVFAHAADRRPDLAEPLRALAAELERDRPRFAGDLLEFLLRTEPFAREPDLWRR